MNMEQQEKQNEYLRGVPPHDATAEQAVLGSMFLDREAASLALEMLTGESFYRPDHRMVFEAAEELYRTGAPIDIITVKNKLEEKGQFEQIGGLSFLATISAAVGSSVNVRHYAAIVEEKSVLRSQGRIILQQQCTVPYRKQDFQGCTLRGCSAIIYRKVRSRL
jgi:replicative DNA helicase